MAGEGSYRPVLEQEIKNLNLEHAVKLLGNRSDVPVLLKLTDYFIFPSHYEGLPGALIEAMFSKTPILASSIPENLECVNEETTLLFPAGNVEAMTGQMINALQTKDWEVRTEKAYALQHFEISSIAAQYEAEYDLLLKR